MRISTHPRIFQRDQFLGLCEDRWHVEGFSIKKLTPTVPEDEVGEHTHAEAHFVLLMEGSYVSSADGATPVSDRPMLIYNPPGTTHRDRFRSEKGRFLTISVSMTVQRHFADAVRLPDHACTLGPAALNVAGRLARDWMVSAPSGRMLTESLCSELLGATAMGFDEVHRRAPAWLRRARERMHDDCGAELALSDIAMAAGVHPVHLTRSFRHHYGSTPGDYLRRCRLVRAASLLARNDSELTAIADACGYCDQSHFSHAFRIAFGLSPRSYRKKVRQGERPAVRARLTDTRPA